MRILDHGVRHASMRRILNKHRHDTHSFESLFAPRSSFVGSVSDVSAFRLTGSPNNFGFSFATSFRLLCPVPGFCFASGFWSKSPSVGAGACTEDPVDHIPFVFLDSDVLAASPEEEGAAAPPSAGVGFLSEVSAFRDTGSPSMVGFFFASSFKRAMFGYERCQG